MKPNLFRRYGLWHCFSGDFMAVGIGYTPLIAYVDWLAREGKAGKDSKFRLSGALL